MNELSKLLNIITQKYEDTPRIAVQELFPLLASHPESHHPPIKKAILLCMEKGHEWGNVMKYIIKWKDTVYQKEFIDRMRQRMDEPPLAAEVDLNE